MIGYSSTSHCETTLFPCCATQNHLTLPKLELIPKSSGLKHPLISAEVLTNRHTNASTSSEKANMLNTFFSSCFNPVVVPPTYCPSGNISNLPDHLDCTAGEVVVLLKKNKIHSAFGPDGMSAWMLHTFADDIGPSMASLFNLSLTTGKLPDDWKVANIVPIPKESNTKDARLYRPISLLSIISKTLERHVYQILVDHLTANSVLVDNQFGFRPGRSTVTPLLLATHASICAKRSIMYHTKHYQINCVNSISQLTFLTGSQTTFQTDFRK